MANNAKGMFDDAVKHAVEVASAIKSLEEEETKFSSRAVFLPRGRALPASILCSGVAALLFWFAMMAVRRRVRNRATRVQLCTADEVVHFVDM